MGRRRAPAVHAGRGFDEREVERRILLSLDYATRAFWPFWQKGERFMPARHITVFAAVAEQWMQAQLDWRSAIEALSDLSDDEFENMDEAQIAPPEGRPRLVIINVPPGCSKSTVWSRTLQPWWWLRHPEWAWLMVSHELERLAYKLHDHRRDIMSHRGYRQLMARQGWRLKRSQVKQATTSAGGHMMMAAGDGKGDGIGHHHHAHVYDDAIDLAGMQRAGDVATVEHTLTQKLADRWKQRRAPAWAAVNQRLLPGDPTDFLKQHAGGDVCHIVLPRAFEPSRYDLPKDHPFHIQEVTDLGAPVEVIQRAFDGDRAWRGYRDQLDAAGFWVEGGRLLFRDWRTSAGQPLDPRRFGASQEAEARANGTWAGPQQQRPEQQGGGIIAREWWDAADDDGGWRRLPAGTPDEIVISADTQKPDQGGVVEPDWTVALVGARYGGHIYLVEVVRARMGGTVLTALLWLLWHRHGRRAVRHALERSMAGEGAANRLRGLGPTVELIKATGTKKERLESVSNLIKAGMVHLPHRDAERPQWLAPDEQWPLLEVDPADVRLPPQLRGADGAPPERPIDVMPPHRWPKIFKDEVCGIGRGVTVGHDDQADALSQLLRFVEGRMGFQPSSLPAFDARPDTPVLRLPRMSLR